MSPVFSWLREWRAEQLRGTLVGIFVADVAGGAMRPVARVEAIAGAGLAGDRYAAGRGHWKQTDACQVTLVTEEDLRGAERRGGLSFAGGAHRRNLVVRGIPLDALRRGQVRIGDALLSFHRIRPRCAYLDRVQGQGVGKALGKGAGIGLKVLEGGLMRIGDEVAVLPPGPAAG